MIIGCSLTGVDDRSVAVENGWTLGWGVMGGGFGGYKMTKNRSKNGVRKSVFGGAR